MADCGVASRRECEEMIAGGRVRVNGLVLTVMPVMIEPTKDIVTVDGEEVGTESAALTEQKKVYYVLNKPKGILVTNHDPSQRKTVYEILEGIKERVFPVGRLELDSRGALIMTNDGELTNRLTHPRYGVEKTYIVEVEGRLSPEDLEKIKAGVWLAPERGAAPGKTATKSERFRAKIVGRERGRTILEIKSSEGKNREIRRVMARIGHMVRDLNRVAIAGKITTRGLEPGELRELTEQEVKWLYYASSQEFHDKERNSTQEWYEQKEMEKERKRIAVEGETQAEKTVKPSKEGDGSKRAKREFRERPKYKGKKPFVPPSGRNAGKALGGNPIGRRRFEADQQDDLLDAPDTPHASDIQAAPDAKPRKKIAHPLGDLAKDDE